jgi:hypothetical protein
MGSGSISIRTGKESKHAAIRHGHMLVWWGFLANALRLNTKLSPVQSRVEGMNRTQPLNYVSLGISSCVPSHFVGEQGL